jgi:Tfp pilus assembly protein FimT
LRNAAFCDREPQHAGFSMVEASIAILIIFTILGFALPNITGVLPGMRANNALAQTVAQLRRGRELALAQRRNIELKFLNGNEIQLVRDEVPNGTTILSSVTLSNNFQFQLFGGIPDTPDQFGKASALDFGGAASLTFLSDGTLVDPQGNPLSGSVFLGLPNDAATARAVTILGATGRVRGYRWNGTSWIQ